MRWPRAQPPRGQLLPSRTAGAWGRNSVLSLSGPRLRFRGVEDLLETLGGRVQKCLRVSAGTGQHRLHAGVKSGEHLLRLIAGFRTQAGSRVDVRLVVVEWHSGVLAVQRGELRLEVALEQLG